MEFNGLFTEANIFFPQITADIGVYTHPDTTHVRDNPITARLPIKNMNIIGNSIQCCQVVLNNQDRLTLISQFPDNLDCV